jgi:hypothetical protein
MNYLKNLLLKGTTYCNGRFYLLSTKAVINLLTKFDKIKEHIIEDHAIGLYLDHNLKTLMLNINSNKYFNRCKLDIKENYNNYNNYVNTTKVLVEKYNIKFNGILHVGAHECEEMNDYEKYISRDKILWIEALEDKVKLMKK